MALDFIEATREIKSLMPLTKISGGVSNVLFIQGQRTCERSHSQRIPYFTPFKQAWIWVLLMAGQLVVYDEMNPNLGIYVKM